MSFYSLFRFGSARTLSPKPLLATAALLGALCVVPLNAHAQTTLVNYGAIGTFTQASPLTLGGITVTSTDILNVHSIGGIGVGQGGNFRTDLINDGETALFTFDNGPATNVNVFIGSTSATNPNLGGTATTLEAYGANGSSLGIFTVAYLDEFGNSTSFSDNANLSSRVNGAAISAFRITGGMEGGASVARIRYTAAAVPEPGEWATMGIAGAGLSGLIIRARRRNAKKRAPCSPYNNV